MNTASPVIGSLCTGYGGLDMGALTAFGDGRIAWVADPDPHVRTVLAARWPDVPNLGDIREVDWSAVEPVDVVTAGFPCQDISAAGRRAGIRTGTRSGLWHHVARAIGSLRPALVVVENVAALRWRAGGLDIVLGDLADAGYACVWNSVRASDVGAAHRRERVFILAWPQDNSANAASGTRAGSRSGDAATVSWGQYEAAIRRWEAILGRSAPHPTEPGRHGRPVLSGRFVEFLMGLDDGFVSGLDIPRTAQLRVLGNGVVPRQASHAIRALLADRAADVGRDRDGSGRHDRVDMHLGY
ncbi:MULTISPECIES: DNA cytosine methyltransferase [Saccharomonospora]|uniref:DNA (cytosine-5-)-methyltransferase n=2 Tax=Saccharomonospora TaxID=1851 RepID=H5X837_9PSEU|nr:MULTISPECIES: DNA cytosine methyltransferase [Saccharomonospora]EHR53569.1 site-specific DNA methylase [Saccharomonospora marina XMU15]